MARSVRWFLVLLAVALVVPLWAQDEKKDAKDKPAAKKDDPDAKKDDKEMKKEGKDAKDKPEVKEKLIPVSGPIQGKLVKKPGAQPVLTLGILVGRDRWQNQEVPVGDDVIVRLAQPPAATDEKGRFKRYTKKELDELRGPDKKLPGYTGTLDDLKEGAYVAVYLSRRSGGPKNFKGAEVPPEYKPHVTMIVILASPN